jgi:hypothetical protein
MSDIADCPVPTWVYSRGLKKKMFFWVPVSQQGSLGGKQKGFWLTLFIAQSSDLCLAFCSVGRRLLLDRELNKERVRRG